MTCVSHIRKILDNIMEDGLAWLAKYPELRSAVFSLVSRELSKNESQTNLQLATHIEAQKSFMNIKHPEFVALDIGVADSEREDIEHRSRPGNFPVCQNIYNRFLSPIEYPSSRPSSTNGSSGSTFFVSQA